LAFGSGLARLLEPRSLVAIIAPNSHYWAIADIGCLLYGFVRIF
jgi:long-subunit acyl-CoA synthetase (AMP-forming)